MRLDGSYDLVVRRTDRTAGKAAAPGRTANRPYGRESRTTRLPARPICDPPDARAEVIIVSQVSTVENLIPFGKYETWCSVTGDLEVGRPPLVALHGGPGSTHDYLRRMTELAADGTPVVLYDQLGNGNSTHLPEKGADFWTVQLFLDELDNLLEQLGIADGYVLFGQSWGGMLGAEHAVLRPAGLRGLVIANSTASMPIWLEEMARLRAELPEDIQEALTRNEQAGTTHTLEYLKATTVFYRRHVCRLRPWPREVSTTLRKIAADPTVYHTMNGPTEFHVVGTIREWSIIDRLALVAVPTLLITGRYDEATPATMRPFFDNISDVSQVDFENSSHMPHLEEPERFDTVMRQFLTRTESAGAGVG